VSAGGFVELGPWQPPGFAPRTVRIFDPGAPQDLRPALFLLDGQDVFASPRAARGGWAVDRAVSGLDPRWSVRPRVIAVPHPQGARQDELTPWPVDGRGGGAWRLLEGIARSLVPEIRARFPTPEGALGAALGGASWGGLCALLGHHAYPEVFGGALALSPALWVGDFAAFDWLAARPKPTFSRIYLDCGAREAEGRMLPPAAELAQRLAARGYGRRQLWWRPDPVGEHTEDAWRHRLPRALRFFFRGDRPRLSAARR
jgi:predicted alpha/beta superfamily hydrolase